MALVSASSPALGAGVLHGDVTVRDHRPLRCVPECGQWTYPIVSRLDGGDCLLLRLLQVACRHRVDSESTVYSHCEQTVWSSWTNRRSGVKLRELPVAVAGLTTMWSRSPSVRLTRVTAATLRLTERDRGSVDGDL